MYKPFHNTSAGWCKSSTRDFESRNHRSTRCPATMRRVLSWCSLSVCCVLLLLPCFFSPASAYEAQGETTWFITDKVYMNGEYYYEITPWSNGEVYYSLLNFYNLDQTMTNIAVNVPGEGDGYFGRMLIFMENTLRIPRSGFYVDEDWYVKFSFGDAYGGDYRCALIDTAQWPVCYYTGVATSSSASRVYSLYCHHDDNNDWATMGVPADAYSDVTTKVFSTRMELYVPTAVMNSVGTNLNTETILVKKTFAGGYSADIVPIVWGPASSDAWEYGELELAYQYYCPVSKLGEYEIGDAFPRTNELDIDAILNALDNAETEYIEQMERLYNLSKDSLSGYNSSLQGWQDTAGGLGFQEDFFDLSASFGSGMSNLMWISQILLMFSGLGVLFLFIRKAVH